MVSYSFVEYIHPGRCSAWVRLGQKEELQQPVLKLKARAARGASRRLQSDFSLHMSVHSTADLSTLLPCTAIRTLRNQHTATATPQRRLRKVFELESIGGFLCTRHFEKSLQAIPDFPQIKTGPQSECEGEWHHLQRQGQANEAQMHSTPFEPALTVPPLPGTPGHVLVRTGLGQCHLAQTDEILSRAPLVLKHVPMSSMQRYWTSNVAKAKTYSEIPV